MVMKMFKIGKLEDMKQPKFQIKKNDKGFYVEIYGNDDISYDLEFELHKNVEDILKIDKTTDISQDVAYMTFCSNFNSIGPTDVNDFTVKLTKYIENKYLFYIGFFVYEELSGIIEIDVDFKEFI